MRPGGRAEDGTGGAPAAWEFFQPRFAAEVQAPSSELQTLLVGELARVRIRGNTRRLADIVRRYLAAKAGAR